MTDMRTARRSRRWISALRGMVLFLLVLAAGCGVGEPDKPTNNSSGPSWAPKPRSIRGLQSVAQTVGNQFILRTHMGEVGVRVVRIYTIWHERPKAGLSVLADKIRSLAP